MFKVQPEYPRTSSRNEWRYWSYKTLVFLHNLPSTSCLTGARSFARRWVWTCPPFQVDLWGRGLNGGNGDGHFRCIPFKSQSVGYNPHTTGVYPVRFVLDLLFDLTFCIGPCLGLHFVVRESLRTIATWFYPRISTHFLGPPSPRWFPALLDPKQSFLIISWWFPKGWFGQHRVCLPERLPSATCIAGAIFSIPMLLLSL